MRQGASAGPQVEVKVGNECHAHGLEVEVLFLVVGALFLAGKRADRVQHLGEGRRGPAPAPPWSASPSPALEEDAPDRGV